MTWNELFEIFNRPLFQLGEKWISLATMVEFIVLVPAVIVLSRLVRHSLRTRVLARTKLEVGQQYAIARIVGYIVLGHKISEGGASGGIERLGAKQDGILRNHQIASNGTLRDTVVYSIIPSEWPTVKVHLTYQLNERER